MALKFNIEISDELGRKIRMSPLGQKIFNEGIEEGKIEKQREIGYAISLLIMAVFFMNSNKLSGGSVQAASKGTYRAILKAYPERLAVFRISKKKVLRIGVVIG